MLLSAIEGAKCRHPPNFCRARWTCSFCRRWQLGRCTVGVSPNAFNRCRTTYCRLGRDPCIRPYTGWNTRDGYVLTGAIRKTIDGQSSIPLRVRERNSCRPNWKTGTVCQQLSPWCSGGFQRHRHDQRMDQSISILSPPGFTLREGARASSMKNSNFMLRRRSRQKWLKG